MKDISSLKNLPHYPVMLKEVLDTCNLKNGGLFVDCTYGAGGYSNAILSYPNTQVIALDRDPNIHHYVKKTKKKYENRFSFYNSKFSDLDKFVSKKLEVDCIIFDLGLSSLQISDLKRGFSFYSKEEPNMGMGLNKNTAKEILNNLDAKTLGSIFRLLGEEKEGLRISKNILRERKLNPIKTIPDLVKIIQKSKKKILKKKQIYQPKFSKH